MNRLNMKARNILSAVWSITIFITFALVLILRIINNMSVHPTYLNETVIKKAGWILSYGYSLLFGQDVSGTCIGFLMKT